MPKMNGKQLKKRLDQLKQERTNWETHWQELADYIYPLQNEITSQREKGGKRTTQIVEPTGVHSNNLLAGALHGMLTNPAVLWFALSSGDKALDENDTIRRWLQESAVKIFDVINNSNFQQEIHALYLSLGCFGTSAMGIDEDPEMIVRFRTFPIANIYVCENYKGLVDEIYREYKAPAEQIIQEFGEKKVPEKVKEAARDGKYQMFDICHYLYPTPKENRDFRNFGYTSEYWIMNGMPSSEPTQLTEKGYRTMPVVVPRWSKSPGEKYGRSPGMNALSDVKMLNAMMETTIKAAQKITDPPLMVSDDGLLGPVRTAPASLNYVRYGSEAKIEPFANDGQPQLSEGLMEGVRLRIREGFFIDQLQLSEGGPQMTATEVMRRTEEKMRLLGPMLGRQQSELLKPLIDRVFDICKQRGVIDPERIPDQLKGRELRVVYSSLIAKAQKSAEAENIVKVIGLVAPFAQADPSVLDNIDGDAAVKYIVKLGGVPQDILRSEDDVQAMRQAKAQAQQQQAQMQNASVITDSLSNAKKSGLLG